MNERAMSPKCAAYLINWKKSLLIPTDAADSRKWKSMQQQQQKKKRNWIVLHILLVRFSVLFCFFLIWHWRGCDWMLYIIGCGRRGCVFDHLDQCFLIFTLWRDWSARACTSTRSASSHSLLFTRWLGTKINFEILCFGAVQYLSRRSNHCVVYWWIMQSVRYGRRTEEFIRFFNVHIFGRSEKKRNVIFSFMCVQCGHEHMSHPYVLMACMQLC